MKIYTKTGDDGTTGLFGGARVQKNDPRVEAYGTVDELNAAIGFARTQRLPASIDGVLALVQVDLFTLGAELACVPEKVGSLKMQLVDVMDATRLETAIDAHEALLPPLKNFVLPGGTPGAAALHTARTIARRAERATLSISPAARRELVVYLNRLSDALFVLARAANQHDGVADVAWIPHPRPTHS
jgi:cob(I)alamin adenosyltransferase